MLLKESSETQKSDRLKLRKDEVKRQLAGKNLSQEQRGVVIAAVENARDADDLRRIISSVIRICHYNQQIPSDLGRRSEDAQLRRADELNYLRGMVVEESVL